MTAKENKIAPTANGLYGFLEEKIPKELSCDWDNDGRMVVPDGNRTIKKVLITLDVSEGAVDYAAENGFDCIISHHPLIFNPVKSVDVSFPIGRKLCKIIQNGICVFSFHTRLDAVDGGVNDVLARLLKLKDVERFSDVGRMGYVVSDACLRVSERFGTLVREALSPDGPLTFIDGGRPVKKVAIVGGSGKDYLEEAIEAGCDTFITGEMPFNRYHDAKELGLNVILGGHYFTENPVCNRLSELVREYDSDIEIEIFESKPAFVRAKGHSRAIQNGQLILTHGNE
ncbi:MAG: Nif3-like dinuclear metal center hexameric protein [Clostridia bacterium]|nr:Nif3-like dinuclear metal center hexameric protein [Clostridia bacterium]